MLLAQNAGMAFGIAIIVFLLFWTAIVILLLYRYFHLWFQAYMSRTPVSINQLLGMSFRKVDPRVVVRCMIMAKQAADVTVSCKELERAYLQGADLEKLTRAMIRAKTENIQITFAELVEADLAGRLAEKLAGSRQ